MPKERFEDALNKLEKIVSKLEEGDVSLEESLKLFEEGIKWSRFCTQKLEEAEKKVEVLLRGKAGEMEAESFDPLATSRQMSRESSKQDLSEESKDPSPEE